MTIEELTNNLDGAISQIRSIQNDIIEHLSSNEIVGKDDAVFCTVLAYSLGAAEITLADISMDVQHSTAIARTQEQEEL